MLDGKEVSKWGFFRVGRTLGGLTQKGREVCKFCDFKCSLTIKGWPTFCYVVFIPSVTIVDTMVPRSSFHFGKVVAILITKRLSSELTRNHARPLQSPTDGGTMPI